MNLIQNQKIINDIYIRFKDSNIKLLDYTSYIFIVMFFFTFKYEENIDLVSNDTLFYVIVNYIFITKLEQT